MLLRLKNVLPASVKRLVDSIESFCGCEIEVRQDSAMLPRDDHSPVACTITEDVRPIMLIRTEEDFTASGALHELLHLERYLVSGVPQLVPVSEECRGTVEDVENILEHLVIIPKASEHGFNHVADEELHAKRQWESLSPVTVQSPGGRAGALLYYLPVHFLVQDQAVRDMALSVLKTADLWYDARKLVEKMERVMSSKADAASTLLRFMRFPREEIRLVYFDPVSRVLRWSTVPEH